jgi:hypothetical protein
LGRERRRRRRRRRGRGFSKFIHLIIFKLPSQAVS